jgi:hypothetical protein
VRNREEAISREAALARLREVVPRTLDREVEHEWIMSAREAGAGWGEIEEAINCDPRREQPHVPEE